MEEIFDKAWDLYDEENYKEAYPLFYALAEQGHCNSKHQVADMLFLGEGVEKDDITAYKWYQEAADGGSAKALHIISTCYIHSTEGYPQDYVKAVEYLQKASHYNYVPAKHDLAIMYFNGNGVLEDKKKTEELLKENCEVDYEDSILLLAQYYKSGTYGFINRFKAFKYVMQLGRVTNYKDPKSFSSSST